MLLAFFLWCILALALSVYAVGRWDHLGLGALFLLLAALPSLAYAWRKGLLTRRRPREKSPGAMDGSAAEDPRGTV